MSEKIKRVLTRTAERTAVPKAPVQTDEGFYDYALGGSPTAVRAWLATAEVDVIGPWVGALIEGDPQRAIVLVRSRQPPPSLLPTGLRFADPEVARGLLGGWAGR
jgi:hypothetical protein